MLMARGEVESDSTGKGTIARADDFHICFLLAPVFKPIEGSAELLQPKIMATTVNAGIIAGDVSVVWRNGLLMLGIALVELALANPFIRRMPEGYDSVLTADGGRLSQGQRPPHGVTPPATSGGILNMA